MATKTKKTKTKKVAPIAIAIAWKDYDTGYKAARIQMEEILSAAKAIRKSAKSSNKDFNFGFVDGWNDSLEAWRL